MILNWKILKKSYYQAIVYFQHLCTTQAAGSTSLGNVQILRRFATVQVDGIIDREINCSLGVGGHRNIHFGFENVANIAILSLERGGNVVREQKSEWPIIFSRRNIAIVFCNTRISFVSRDWTFINCYKNRKLIQYLSLPEELVSADNLNIFKSKIDQYFDGNIHVVQFNL